MGLQQGPPSLTQEQRQEALLLQMKLKANSDRSLNFVSEFDKWMKDPGRPPSPAPIYGPDGKRANTAEVRFKMELQRDRAELLAKLSKLQPQAAVALGEAPKKPTRKLYIPIKEFPNVCFMGLILGPRGNHHKRMEKDSGCRIRIRGKGSLREGSRGKDAQRDLDDEKDDLHVYIEGPSEEAVQSAVEMVEPLLNPESRDVEDLKDKHQLELAEINGTLKQDDYCHICGEKGHRQWECPAKQRTYAMANVRCALCGDTSHPTRDCALNKKDQPDNGLGVTPIDDGRKKVDSQFLDFMSEIGADPKALGYSGAVAGFAPATTAKSSGVSAAPQALPAVSGATNGSGSGPARAPGVRPIQFAQQQPQQPRIWFSQSPQDAWYYQQRMQQQQASAAAYNQYYASYLQQQQQHQAYAAYAAYTQQQQQQHSAYYQQQPAARQPPAFPLGVPAAPMQQVPPPPPPPPPPTPLS